MNPQLLQGLEEPTKETQKQQKDKENLESAVTQKLSKTRS